ncbi:MAG: glycosyltransferase family 39 protein [Planctomycetaceae bacterium]|nr:glycosyltransferase family 39 protein [Planctomycetaceae bacterium]
MILSAGVLRFYHLGTWSFGYDELFTTLETKILFGETTVPDEDLHGGTVKPEDVQYYRLPRLLFASHSVHQLGYTLFGTNEFGSRVLMAILGSLSVGVIFLLAQPLIGCSGAIILALLVMLLPEHLFHSQYNRFYIQSFFLVSIVILLGAHVAQKHSKVAAFWLGPFSVLLVLSNSFGGVIWGGVLIALLVNAFCAKRFGQPQKISGKPVFSRNILTIILMIFLWSVILLGIFVFHIVPLAGGWNNASGWGYTPLHAVMAFINMLGWQLCLFSTLGIVLAAVNIRNNANAYWLSVALVSGVAVLVLPTRIVYLPFYGFVFLFPFIVTTALFIREVYQLLATSNLPFRSMIAVFWIVAATLLNFPTLISYYQDGNRPDHRAAFQYVAEHWEEDDVLTGFMMGTAQYYIPDKKPRIPLRTENTAQKLQQILDQEIGNNNRLWIVLHSSRNGLNHELRIWVSQHAILQKVFTKKRFDYAENNVEIFLVPKKSERK